MVPHLDEVTSGGRQLTGRFISHHCIGLAFSPSTIREGVKKNRLFLGKSPKLCVGGVKSPKLVKM